MSSAKKAPAKAPTKTASKAPKKSAPKAAVKASTDKKASDKIDIKKPKTSVSSEEIIFAKEYWTGDSRDGTLVNGEGYHYYRMTKTGKILEAFECYETEDGRECVSICPEMVNVHWIEDLGYEDFEILDMIKEYDFSRIKDIASGVDPS